MKKYKDLFIALLAFLIYFSFSIASSYIMELFNINTKNIGTVRSNIILITYELILMGLLFLLYRKDIIEDFKNYTANKGKWFFKNFGIFMLGILIMGIVNVALSKITNLETSNNEELVRKYIKIIPVYMGFSTVIYAPFVEELLFRKCIREIINGNDKTTKIIYILVSAIFFGLMHVLKLDASFNDILMGIPYMIVGLAFAYIYCKTDNLFSTMQFHLMHNTFALLIQLLLFR